MAKPIILTDNVTGEKYTLEFNRESVKFAEGTVGFCAEDLRNGRNTMAQYEKLFYSAFRMHHKNVSLGKALDILYNDLGGFPEGMTERLIELYIAPYSTLLPDKDEAVEGEGKNPRKITVEM